MQHSPNEIKEKLLKALDQDNNVVDMGTVMEVITILEKIQITKEALEKTRLGKYINELRKKTTNEILARRAKQLVRSWRQLIMPENAINGDRTVQMSTAVTLDPGLKFLHANKPLSPALTNHRLHRNRSNSPIGVSSPIDSYCSSTSTSPALMMGYPGSRPSTPSVFAPKTKVASPEKDNPTSSAANLPSCIQQPSPPLNVTLQPKSHVVNDVDHNLKRYQPITSDSENNFHKATKHNSRATSPALSINDKVISCSHSLSVDVVAKTNAANKRLRKENNELHEDGPRKKICADSSVDKTESINTTKLNCGVVNGVYGGDSNDSSRSIQEDFQESEIKVPSESISATSKKSERNSRIKKEAGDSLKEKLATHTRTNKVKTTAQLIEALKARNTSVSSLNVSSLLPCQADLDKASSSRASPIYARRLANNVLGTNADHDMTKTKSELIEKFLRSSADSDSEDGHDHRHDHRSALSASLSMKAESHSSVAHENKCEVKSRLNCVDDGVDPVEVILASLPPLKPEEIDWGDDDEVDSVQPKIEPVSDVVVNKLHSEPWEGLNGNYDHEQKFREWHEALSRRSCNNDLLHILPYVNTD